ncbi:MAG: hypothetical protein Kow0031_21460 [Anaerolineae bacterium]
MAINNYPTYPKVYTLFVWLLLLALTGCQQASNSPATAEASPAATATRLSTPTAISPALVATATPAATPEDATLTLTLWTIEPISPLANDEAAAFFNQTISRFERANPGVTVDVLVKKPSGKGGVLDFLRTASAVAPAVMPDVVVMNATDTEQAFAERLIQPLDGKLDRSIVQDLLPAARRVGTVQENLAGVPMSIEMQHSAYNTRIFTETTVLWSDVLSRSASYSFPAKGNNGLVNDITLSHYFTAGGNLLDDEDRPKIDEKPLRDTLGFYQQLLEAGLIDDSLLEAATTEELWPNFVDGQADVAQISVRQYLTDQPELEGSALPGPPPLPNGEATSVGVMHAWVFSLVTSDINRQEEALRLMESFLSTEANVTWNQLNKSIPVRDSSFQQLAGADPYWQLLTSQLNTARPEPRFTGYDRVGRIFQQAVEQVLRGEATAEEAASTAVDALAQ